MSETLRAPLLSQRRESLGDVELPAEIFGVPVRSHLLYEAVRMQLANRRAGTAATKTRGQVRGGGKKPWRQKGTGWARAGSNRSPIWVGGATTFGPQPRDYSYRLPRSARKAALRSALSGRLREGRLLVLDRLEFPGGKTREAAEALRALEAPKPLLVVLEKDDMLDRATRNLPGVKVLEVAGLNVYDVLNHESLVLTADAVEAVKERLA